MISYLHILQSLVHDFLRIFQSLQHIVEIGFSHSGKSIKQIHVQGSAAATAAARHGNRVAAVGDKAGLGHHNRWGKGIAGGCQQARKDGRGNAEFNHVCCNSVIVLSAEINIS